EWECIPEQRQRIEMLDRCPHHRRAGLGRSLRTGRRFAIAPLGAEEFAVDAAQHDLLARESDAGEPAASIARSLSDEQHARLANLLEVKPQIVAADCALTTSAR